MIETKPRVFLVAEPTINTKEMLAYLREVGGEEWFYRVFDAPAAPGTFGEEIPAAEGLVEFMGRMCYRSWAPGLNANVTKIREDRGDYLLNVLKQAHGSILEHATFSFVLHDVSRVVTAELNRHRAGVAISEQSLRYVRLDELRFRIPDFLTEETQTRGRVLVEHIENEIRAMLEAEGIDRPDLDFSDKKRITSAVRRWAPLGLSTEEGWSANIRALRHVIERRGDEAAEEEIQIVARQIYDIMSARCPLLFADYDERLQTPYAKV